MWLVSICLVLLSVLDSGRCLTAEELGEFTSLPNNCGGTVTVTGSATDATFRIQSKNRPNHNWGCAGSQSQVPVDTDVDYTIVNSPTRLTNPVCVNGGGAIGIAKNGVMIYGALTSSKTDAGEETMDCCGGHADPNGKYHYHDTPQGNTDICDTGMIDDAGTEYQFFGVALDGYPIYYQPEGMQESDKVDLDACHGGTINPGTSNEKYAYIAKSGHFPYFIGCLWALPSTGSENAERRPDCTSTSDWTLCYCDAGSAVYATQTNLPGSSKRGLSQKDTRENALLEILQLIQKRNNEVHKKREKRTAGKRFIDLLRSLDKRTESSCYEQTCSISYNRGTSDKRRCNQYNGADSCVRITGKNGLANDDGTCPAL